MKLHVPNFSTAKVLVAGDLMLDRYWHGATLRISPEAPVPVVKVEECEDRPGGAANVALNVAALGAQVSVVGIVGEDEAAHSLSNRLTAAGVQAQLVPIEGLTTITKLRVISRHQQLIRLDFETVFPEQNLGEFMQRFKKLLPKHDVVVFSDYGKGTLRLVQELIGRARSAGKIVLADPKNPRTNIYRGATLLTPNMHEFESMVGDCPSEQVLVEKGLGLIRDLELEALLITRGDRGMTLLRPGCVELHFPSQAREVFDVTGAGDTVIATTATAMAAGLNLDQAVGLANLAAGIVVSKLGTATVSAPELRRHVILKGDIHRGVVNEQQLMIALQEARGRGERLVMTNGCFDILHAGHVSYLEKARQLGDRLIVAVNDDDSVRRLKGLGRPVNGIERRMSVLAALSFVDWVVPFSEDTPKRLICSVLPDVLVKGGDYKVADIVGRDCVIAAGGEVRTIELLKGVSTSAILESVREKVN